MTSEAGDETTDRQSIADVFAAFYEDLYQRRDSPNAINDNRASNDHATKPTTPDNENATKIPPITDNEVHKALDGLDVAETRAG